MWQFIAKLIGREARKADAYSRLYGSNADAMRRAMEGR